MNDTFAKQSTSELVRRYRWHDQDRGTMTYEDECRRMFLLHELGAELERREFPVQTLYDN